MMPSCDVVCDVVCDGWGVFLSPSKDGQQWLGWESLVRSCGLTIATDVKIQLIRNLFQKFIIKLSNLNLS